MDNWVDYLKKRRAALTNNARFAEDTFGDYGRSLRVTGHLGVISRTVRFALKSPLRIPLKKRIWARRLLKNSFKDVDLRRLARQQAFKQRLHPEWTQVFTIQKGVGK